MPHPDSPIALKIARKKLRYARNKWQRVTESDRDPKLVELWGFETINFGSSVPLLRPYLISKPSATVTEVLEALELMQAVRTP